MRQKRVYSSLDCFGDHLSSLGVRGLDPVSSSFLPAKPFSLGEVVFDAFEAEDDGSFNDVAPGPPFDVFSKLALLKGSSKSSGPPISPVPDVPVSSSPCMPFPFPPVLPFMRVDFMPVIGLE